MRKGRKDPNGRRGGAKRQPCGVAKLLGDRWLHQRVVPTKKVDPSVCMMCGDIHGNGLPCPELTVMCKEEQEGG